MFDTVGRTVDVEAGRRGATAAALALLLCGSMTAAALAVSAWKAVEAVVTEADQTPMIETFLREEDLTAAALPLPPPPPPPAAGPAAEEEEPETQPVPDQMDEDVPELDEEVAPEVSSEPGSGSPDGVADGDPDGQKGGVVGGDPNGDPTGSLFAGPRVIHVSEVAVKRRWALRYPEAARGLGLGEVTCRARVFIDERGVPYDVAVETCPSVFHGEVQTGLSRWRWEPARAEGVPTKAQFLIVVRFVP